MRFEVAGRTIEGGEPGSLVGLSWVCHETTGLHSIGDLSRDRFGAMNRRPMSGARERRVPAGQSNAGLRPDHPLLQASEAVHYTGRQWIHVAAVLAGSVIARIEGQEWASPLAYSAASVLLILTLLLAAHRQRERDCAIDLILDGREHLPLSAVQRQRQRLLAERTRHCLGSNLENAVRQATKGRRRDVCVTTPLFEATVVAGAVDELREVIGLLQTEGVRARGVARVERLIEHATSPLYGQDPGALHHELRQVRELLKDRDT